MWQRGCDTVLVDRDTLIGGAAFPGVLPTKKDPRRVTSPLQRVIGQKGGPLRLVPRTVVPGLVGFIQSPESTALFKRSRYDAQLPMLEGLVGLDSVGPSVYIVLGVLWILVSRLVRGRGLPLPFRVKGVGKGDRAAVVLNKKLVPINRNTRVS